MTDFVDQFLKHADVVRGDPPSASTIEALAARYGTAFPEPLLRIWNAGDLWLETLDAHVPGAGEVLQLVEKGGWPGELLARGLVPLLNDHQSNYLAVMVQAPLPHRVVHVPHDNGTRMLYRDLNGFARGMLEALGAGKSADLFLHETKGDYPPHEPRPQADQDAARLLLGSDGSREEWNYATQLLDEGNLAEWEQLLETEHFVRRDVLARMRQLQSPAIRELLARDRHAFGEFALDVAEAARDIGMKVGERREGVLRVEGSWMNLDAFYHRRRIPDALPRMMAWFQDLLARRDPRERPGNFMKD